MEYRNCTEAHMMELNYSWVVSLSLNSTPPLAHQMSSFVKFSLLQAPTEIRHNRFILDNISVWYLEQLCR